MHLFEANNNLQKFSYGKFLTKIYSYAVAHDNIVIRNTVIDLKRSRLIGSTICTEI